MFFNLMKNELSTNFYGILIIFHKVVKLQNVEFDVNDVIPAVVQIISHLLLCIIFSTFSTNIYVFVDPLSEVMKLRSYEWLDAD